MREVKYQIYLCCETWHCMYVYPKSFSFHLMETSQTNDIILRCCFVIDVKIMETTEDKRDVMNVAVKENILQSLVM